MAEQTGSSGLFSVFMLSIYSLILIPYTLSRLCSSAEDTSQPVIRGKKLKPTIAERLKKHVTKGNVILVLLWLLWLGLVWYVQLTTAEMQPFDPFAILGVDRSATPSEIKKAYRQLSLQFHPDKNPDPKAAKIFAERISPAYRALTDETSRSNYEKHGHPDGPQGMNLGVALPSWMFSADRRTAPLMLLGLVGVGILLPLGIMSWYMLSSGEYVGPNQVHRDTLVYFMHSKFCVKESQSLVRIPETLMCAMEFITLYTPGDHQEAVEEIRREIAPIYTELMAKGKKAFWERKASVVKSHMLLLAHLERMGPQVPAVLQPDLRFVLAKTHLLLEEILKIALLARPPAGYGWMTPSLAAVEMMQCVAAAIPTAVRKPTGGKGGDTLAPLLALPHFDADVVKKLKKQRLNSTRELQALPEAALSAALEVAGLKEGQLDEAIAALSALPELALSVRCLVDGEEEVAERDTVLCKVRVLLSRPSHKLPGFALKGSSVRAYTPHNPVPRDESWYFFLVDPAANSVLHFTKANLMEAERQGLQHPQVFNAPEGAVAALAADGDVGQEVVLPFVAARAGRQELQLVVMSDCWVGADEVVAIKLKVAAQSRAAAEGRDTRSRAAAKAWESSDDDRSEAGGEVDGEGSAAGSGASSQDGDDSGDDWDSDETGELETGSEEEEGGERGAAAAAGQGGQDGAGGGKRAGGAKGGAKAAAAALKGGGAAVDGSDGSGSGAEE